MASRPSCRVRRNGDVCYAGKPSASSAASEGARPNLAGFLVFFFFLLSSAEREFFARRSNALYFSLCTFAPGVRAIKDSLAGRVSR